MLQLHSSHGKLAHESSELKIVLEHEAEAGDFFLVFCGKLGRRSEVRKSSLTGVQKSCFSSRDAQKKNTIVLVHVKTIEFKYRIYSNKHRGPIQKMLIL